MYGANMIKRIVKDVIYRHQSKCFHSSLLLYPKLSLFTLCIKGSYQMWSWLVLASIYPELFNKCKLLIRILYRETSFNDDTYMYSNNGSKLCQMCCSYKEETAEHVLFQCESYNQIRQEFMVNLQAVAPPPMYEAFRFMNNKEKLCFILCAMNSNIVLEWLHVYNTLLNFVSEIYNVRKGQV